MILIFTYKKISTVGALTYVFTIDIVLSTNSGYWSEDTDYTSLIINYIERLTPPLVRYIRERMQRTAYERKGKQREVNPKGLLPWPLVPQLPGKTELNVKRHFKKRFVARSMFLLATLFLFAASVCMSYVCWSLLSQNLRQLIDVNEIWFSVPLAK